MLYEELLSLHKADGFKQHKAEVRALASLQKRVQKGKAKAKPVAASKEHAIPEDGEEQGELAIAAADDAADEEEEGDQE